MSVQLCEPPIETAAPATTSSPEISIRALDDTALASLNSDWRSLFEQDDSASAWQHPQSVAAECEQRPASPHPPLLITSHSNGGWDGAAILLPKTIRTNQAGGIGPGWSLNGYRLVGGRFLDASRSAATADALWSATLEALGARRADFLLIEDLDEQAVLAHQLAQGLPAGWKLFVPNGRQARLRIEFPESGPGYWEQFSKKTLSTFRRKLKKFGATRLERITRADQVPEFLARAHEISLQTWQTRSLGLRVRNSAAERASLTALADAGLLRSYLWHSNDEPAAFCIGNQAHGVFNYEEVGYATKFARFSPGQMLVVQMIEDLLAHDRPACFDFGGGDAEYKRMFANRKSSSGTVWVTPPSWKARGSLAWIQGCRSLKQAARTTIQKFGLATRVRQWIRYGGQPVAGEANGDAGSNSQDEEGSA